MDHGHREIWIDASSEDVYRHLADFRLERSGHGTTVLRTAAADFRWRVLRLLRPLVYRTLVPHMLGRDLAALKECVEADVHGSAQITSAS